MLASIYLATLFGSYITAASIPMIFDPSRMRSMLDAFMKSEPLIFFTGVLALFGGVSVVFFHNIWSADWRIILTVFGWIAAIEGALLIIAPKYLLRFANAILARDSLLRIFGCIYLVLGIFLITRLFY